MTKSRAIIIEIDGVLSDDSHRRHLIEKSSDCKRCQEIHNYIVTTGNCHSECEVCRDWKPDFDTYHAACGEDGVNEWCKEICWHHSNLGASDLIIITDRPEKYRETTQKWLSKLGFEYQLFMRPECEYPPLRFMKEGKEYHRIDASTPSDIYKKQVYEFEIKDKYEVLFVIDKGEDCNMWKSLELTTLEVK